MTSLAFLLVMLGREIALSRWLLYPLAYFPLPVDWRAADPTPVSDWITWYARAPGTDGTSAQDGSWLGPWVQSAWASREVSLARWMVAAAVLPLLRRRGRRAWQSALPTIPLGLIPPIAVALAWFITAPDIRFGWLGALGIAAVPLSLLLHTGAYPYWVVPLAGVLLLVLLPGTQVLNSRVFPRGAPPGPVTLMAGPFSVKVLLASEPKPTTTSGSLADGTPVINATKDGSCWSEFPLCLLPGSGAFVEQRGS